MDVTKWRQILYLVLWDILWRFCYKELKTEKKFETCLSTQKI